MLCCLYTCTQSSTRCVSCMLQQTQSISSMLGQTRCMCTSAQDYRDVSQGSKRLHLKCFRNWFVVYFWRLCLPLLSFFVEVFLAASLFGWGAWKPADFSPLFFLVLNSDVKHCWISWFCLQLRYYCSRSGSEMVFWHTKGSNRSWREVHLWRNVGTCCMLQLLPYAD